MNNGDVVPLTARQPDPDEFDFKISAISVLEHLDQLRRRIIYSCIAVAVGVVVAFAFINPIFAFLFEPIRSVLPQGSHLIYTVPGEAFSVYVQVALIAGVIFASPFVFYQAWRFIAPALFLKDKRYAIPFVVLTTAGFVGGALFNHYVAFRWIIAFFGSFNSSELAFMPRLDDAFGLYTKLLFGLALVFQMPTVVFFLARMGVVSARFLLRQFKYAVFIIFIAAAVITPGGDMATQTLFALPMIGLYLISILIAWVFGPAARKDEENT